MDFVLNISIAVILMVTNNDSGDYELWLEASKGDRLSEEKLIEKYNRLVKICARPYFLAGGDSEDLIQEGMMGLMSAIRQYDPKRDTSFKTYAESCIRNRLLTAVKSASRNKHTPLNDYVSIESPQFDESRTDLSESARDPEELVIARERYDEISAALADALSAFEKKVLEQYLLGLSYAEIGQALGRSPKSIDNAVQRIRRKLAQFN